MDPRNAEPSKRLDERAECACEICRPDPWEWMPYTDLAGFAQRSSVPPVIDIEAEVIAAEAARSSDAD